ncbi:aldehyde dehydrogenase [Periconia macrospinosa]|uniref:Aldehyde dehydrogenase n=1 Tax=Periconia macrospinosa TaxID=97972 RepID=A0A2V1DXB6_9PLEO|nr:aldehyde dehydrogenase [Periconia macrospinosa]
MSSAIVKPTGNGLYQIPLIINGQDVTTTSSFTVRNPSTSKPIWESSTCSEQNAIEAVTAAEKAFPSWSQTTPSDRRDIFLRAAEILTKRKPEMAAYMREEIAANEHYQNFILGLAIEGLKDTAGRIADAVQGFVPTLINQGARGIVYREPYGVVLGIGPWNAPYHLGLRAVTFAIATGNTTVLKGPELSPRCYWGLSDIFREAGLPDGVLNLLLHDPKDAPKITETLVAHSAVRKVNFTGSSHVGSIISSLAGKHLKPVLMELGGKANAIVLPDADIRNAAHHCAIGAFTNAGQICMSTERILVHSSIADKFQTAFKEAIESTFGTRKTYPVVVTNSSARRNRMLVKDALNKGAKLVHGDLNQVDPEVEAIMPPVVLSKMSPNMNLYGGESFGPSVSLYTYETEEEAIELANDTDYGLAASIFTEDLRSGMHIARQLQVGGIHINTMTVHDEFGLPHGGYKKSGFGRFNGKQGLEEFLTYKTVTWTDD